MAVADSAKAIARVEAVAAPAQPKDVEVPSASQTGFLTSLLRDEAQIWTSPFRLTSEDAVKFGMVLAATAVLIATDESTYPAFRDYERDHAWVQKASPIATQLGEFYVPYSIAGAFCLKGLLFDDNEAVETGLLSVQAMIHSAIAVQVLKHLFGRTRPFVRDGQDKWYGPKMFFKRYSGGFSSYDAFPSGHTITAFSLATVIAERSEETWVDITAYLLAGACGLSRLTEHDHWLSDVAVGAAMGVAIGKLVVRNHKSSLELAPSFGSRSAGLSVQLNY